MPQMSLTSTLHLPDSTSQLTDSHGRRTSTDPRIKQTTSGCHVKTLDALIAGMKFIAAIEGLQQELPMNQR